MYYITKANIQHSNDNINWNTITDPVTGNDVVCCSLPYYTITAFAFFFFFFFVSQLSQGGVVFGCICLSVVLFLSLCP